MIETLNGIAETVHYKPSTSTKLYDNQKIENYPAHWHPTPEIIMPIDNTYRVDCYGESITLQEGDIIIICPGCVHTLYAPETAGRRIIFQADINQLRFMKDIDTLLSILSPYVVITRENYPDIHGRLQQLIMQIRDEYLDSASTFSEMSIYRYLLEIFVLIGRSSATISMDKPGAAPSERQENYMEKFLEICSYISEHCTEELCLDDIAAMSGFSKYHFSRLFKQFTSVSFYKYVSQKRIEKAAQLLLEPSMSITNVALSCGFDSLSSFIRMFKIIKGTTPSEFRSLYQHC